ncbi:hypothetical protein BIW11_11284 [Tropilaelaps mercedesae]|uniref:Calponin-homology (CH) domain-containing protein n=1 Tax=Tropilaelaps mercedesae TaxID=418985 RepID=A0A1V9XC27_9ACAR|nr:hypothetical protein BIW11_11284 [Tropilaelaps mercedesae]
MSVHSTLIRLSAIVQHLSELVRAKERSTLLWLLAKAHKGRIPADLRSPHYKESENQYRLKPDIVDLLCSCKMYCMVLRNLYEDPAYFELSFAQIFSMLERKGIEMKPLKDGIKVTPIILEECSPLNMSAHLNFSDALMELFIREVLIPSKVFQVVQRFTHSTNNSGTFSASTLSLTEPSPPADAEDAAILWINRSAQALREKVHTEHKVMLPKVVHVQDLSDLCDGSALASLISLYCPQQLPVQDITFTPSMTLSDSLANQHLVKDFCERHLPQDVHLVCLEDMLFLHASMRTNVLAFLADLMYLFEIRPFKAVQVPGIAQYIVVKRESPNRDMPVTEL